jgi:hypothetical protein
VAVRWRTFIDPARVPVSTRAGSFHFGGSTVTESLALILAVLVILMGLGVISGAVVVTGLALFHELSDGERQPR